MNKITVRGARTHNLKNVNLTLPRDQLIVITGLSGSGKSSLAFDTLYAEGQRRYVESLSAYARQFLSLMEKPDVDLIEGLSPAISIEQKATSHNPRSTVGTITEISDYLRLLFARIGVPHCPEHGCALQAQTITQMVERVLQEPAEKRLMLLAPVVRGRKGTHEKLLKSLASQGFIRARINGEVIDLSDPPALALHKKHDIEIVVDRFKVRDDVRLRLSESFETTLALADGLAMVASMDADDETQPLLFSANYACPHCGYSVDTLEPQSFSFNSPSGACPHCDGLGVKQFFDPDKIIHNDELSLEGGAIRGWDRHSVYYSQLLDSLAQHYDFDISAPFASLPEPIKQVVLYGSGKEKIKFHYRNERGNTTLRTHPFEGVIPNFERRYKETTSNRVRDDLSRYLSTSACPECNGTRLNTAARHVFINQYTLPDFLEMAIDESLTTFKNLALTGQQATIAEKILQEISERLTFLVNVGLNYLTLSRSADTLSGGEAQRIRLASQIGAGLVGVMYVLDEPSIGLHQRDNDRLLQTLMRLRDLGNTVIVVEHDEDAIRLADHIIDIGPGAGRHGGQVVAQGTASEIMEDIQSLTGAYLSGRQQIDIPQRLQPSDKWLELKGACGNNLKSVDLRIPCGLLTCITGVSGSGKSTLINDTLYRIAQIFLNGAVLGKPAPYDACLGLRNFDKVIDVDQSPIGRTPRSNPATYTGIFTPIRELFANTKEARSRGYKPGRFSFNVKGGRCEACEGDGVIKVEMHFLPDVYVTCDHCHGKRYNRETLDIQLKGKNIHEVLEMTAEEACEFFQNVPVLSKKLQTLVDVGLGYIRLGQSATTLSGGEAQRVKLAKELSKREGGRVLYILDEPTTGLHFHDIKQLLGVISSLRARGHTIVVIEHNLDVIKTADWIVDLGPEGGDGGGEIIAQGAPEDVMTVEASHTGRFLRSVLKK